MKLFAEEATNNFNKQVEKADAARKKAGITILAANLLRRSLPHIKFGDKVKRERDKRKQTVEK